MRYVTNFPDGTPDRFQYFFCWAARLAETMAEIISESLETLASQGCRPEALQDQSCYRFLTELAFALHDIGNVL
jgi:hypothetical protein